MKTGFTRFTGWGTERTGFSEFHPANPVHPVCSQHRIVAELDALQVEVDALLPAILDGEFNGQPA